MPDHPAEPTDGSQLGLLTSPWRIHLPLSLSLSEVTAHHYQQPSCFNAHRIVYGFPQSITYRTSLCGRVDWIIGVPRKWSTKQLRHHGIYSDALGVSIAIRTAFNCSYHLAPSSQHCGSQALQRGSRGACGPTSSWTCLLRDQANSIQSQDSQRYQGGRAGHAMPSQLRHKHIRPGRMLRAVLPAPH